MDVRLPDFIAYVAQTKSLSQVTDWANKYHKSKEFTNEGEGAIIFIVDTAGTFQDHDDLRDNNPTYLNGNSTPNPDKDGTSGHGTHCAGIAAAVNNDRGVIGIAPKALLGARKALGDNGSGAYSWIASEIRKVADLKLRGEHEGRKKIISMSLGGTQGNSVLKSAVDYAISKGCFVIAAAGNSGYSGSDTVKYPANYPEVIAVASIEKDEDPSRFSSGGDNVDIAAYGDGNFSTYKNNTYATLRGTSMATPVVSGLVALILTEYPEIDTQDKLMTYLKDNAKDIFEDGFDVRTGYGTLITTDFKEPKDAPDKEPPKEEPPVEEPKPEPPTPPKSNPIKSQVDLWLNDVFTVSIRNADEQWVRCKVKVEATADINNEADLKQAQDLTKRFFSGRGFYFSAGSGVDRWADYVSRFLYILTKNWGKPVYATKIWLAKDDLKIIKSVNPRNFKLSTYNTTVDSIELDGVKTFDMTEMKIILPQKKIVVDRNENLPIDKLKEVIGDGFGVADALFDIMGKGDTAKGLMALAGIVGKYDAPIEAFKVAWEQAGDLSEEESVDLYAFVTERFDIEDDELELKIERILKLPITGYAEYLDTVDTLLIVQSIWKDETMSRWAKIKALSKYASSDALDQGEDLVDLVTEFISAFRDLFRKKKEQ
jgi:hypothetical protein